jgi:hypothetical protein
LHEGWFPAADRDYEHPTRARCSLKMPDPPPYN